DVTVRVEIRDGHAYVSAGQERGAGGMPRGTSGKVLLLLSGGIDSPVAGHMMARRGATVEAVHFESYPYTSVRAREKVLKLAGIMSRYTSRMKVHVVSVTDIQLAIRDNCREEYFTLILRRFMMKIARRLAWDYGCSALVTGESLGQVASQTLSAIGATDSVCDIPVFRPLIGMDKEEIIVRARQIGTFDTSILPYEDCCTVFTPRHPKLIVEMDKLVAEEQKLDADALIKAALSGRDTVVCTEEP
ncbi:MAG: tRNA 4-thiouridine(8) synthase ThiI, partial [Clostridia bacterium]|nr:tRNA 4-thiouridine(8) synthase ThiI [Clostridia bacterium]